MQNGSPPWTSAGASTMSVSKKEMSGRQPSPQTKDSLSCSSCSLVCNSPATFQTMMNDILCPFIDCNKAICYMDDILIYSSSLADHWRITREILQTLCSYKLFL